MRAGVLDAPGFAHCFFVDGRSSDVEVSRVGTGEVRVVLLVGLFPSAISSRDKE